MTPFNPYESPRIAADTPSTRPRNIIVEIAKLCVVFSCAILLFCTTFVSLLAIQGGIWRYDFSERDYLFHVDAIVAVGTSAYWLLVLRRWHRWYWWALLQAVGCLVWLMLLSLLGALMIRR